MFACIKNVSHFIHYTIANSEMHTRLNISLQDHNFSVDCSPHCRTVVLFAQGVNKRTTPERSLNRFSKTVEAYLGLLRNNTSTHKDIWPPGYILHSDC